MSYIDRNLLPGETILFRTRKSVVLFVPSVVLLLLSIVATDYFLATPLLTKLVFVPWVITGIYFFYALLQYYSSEYAVTDSRIMMREGLFTRHSNEMRLTAISQVNVDQTLFGMMFNFGTVSINAFGAFDGYQLISNPFRFQRTVNQQLDILLRQR